jgi:hypothetical protein
MLSIQYDTDRIENTAPDSSIVARVFVAAEVCSWRGPAANLLNWTEAVQVTKTNDRPDLSSEGKPDIGKAVIVKQ